MTYFETNVLITKTKPMPLQNGQFGANIKIAKDMRQTTLEPHYGCSTQKKKKKKMA